MEASKSFTLPKLPYGYKALAPYISEEQLTLHHQKHHQAYVTGANALLEKFDKARKDNADLDMKATLKELSFHIGGYRLHKKFFGKSGTRRCWWRRSTERRTCKSDRCRVREIRPVQKGVYPGCVRCRRIRLGSTDVLHEYRAAPHHAAREAQCQRDTGIPDPDGHSMSGSMHTILITRMTGQSLSKHSGILSTGTK